MKKLEIKSRKNNHFLFTHDHISVQAKNYLKFDVLECSKVASLQKTTQEKPYLHIQPIFHKITFILHWTVYTIRFSVANTLASK